MQCSTSSADDIDVGKGVKTVEVLRAFNNNVVLAKDGRSEVILTGRGLGCQASASTKRKSSSDSFHPTDVTRIIWRNCWLTFRLKSSDWLPKP